MGADFYDRTLSAIPMSVLPFEEAYGIVQQYGQNRKPTQQESISLSETLGRILAEPVVSDRDFPPFPRATRDGYAIRAADAKEPPAVLSIIGQVRAGGTFEQIAGRGQAVEIMTGAAVPRGADAVVMVEYTKRNSAKVEILRSVREEENIVPQGSEAKANEEVVPPGTRIGPAQIAMAAAVGRTALRVHKKPRVAILATGDELVEINSAPSARQIRNTNSYSLAAQVTIAGGEPLRLPIALDQKPTLRKLIEQGLSTDLLLVSGGVSMGKFDLVESVLAELEAKFLFTGAQIQPGRPVVFAEALSTPCFGLPGNPVSTMVTFDLFVRPLLQAIGGAIPVRLPSAKARLGKQLKVKLGLTRFLPGVLHGNLYDAEVEVLSWHGSGDIPAVARANCYVIVPPDRELMVEGEMISILLRS
jgi:molybdopterin molybdotransferase